MKNIEWWTPKNPHGTLLSSQYVKTFVAELPELKAAELTTTLRYKVQALLPIQADDFSIHTRFFKQGKKTYGAAFLSPSADQSALPESRDIRVGVPLTMPKVIGERVLLFISTPAGLSAAYYEAQVLKTSFAPIDDNDVALRSRIVADCPGAEIICIDPDQRYPLPKELLTQTVKETLRDTIVGSFPLWKEPPRRGWPLALAILLAALGITLIGLALAREVTVRVERNEAWKAWLAKTDATLTTRAQSTSDRLIKEQGAPLPELFEHLAADWGSGTRVIDLEWTESKLSMTAVSPSALGSIQRLTADRWFKAIKVVDIKTQKDGSEEFTIEGGLNFDSK